MDLCLPSFISDLSISRAIYTDVEDIVRLRESVVEKSLRPMSSQDIGQTIDEFYIAKLEHTPIGCLRLFVVQSVIDTIELGSLVVLPEYRGQGYCRRLIEFGEDFARERNSELILVTDNNRLERTLEERSWRQDMGQLQVRKNESPGKRLYTIDLTSREK